MSEPVLRVGIAASDGCMMSSVASAADAFGIAQAVSALRGPERARRFEVTVFNAGGADRVRTSAGVDVSCRAGTPDALDVVLVPGIMHAGIDELDARVRRMDAEMDALRRLHDTGTTIAASCAGGWVLGAAGLLDGRRATISWWLGAAFQRRFPAVRLDADAVVVEDGPFLTGGAASAVLDIVLKLVARAADETLAQQVGRILLTDGARRSQAPYVDTALLERPRLSSTERAARFLRDNLHRDVGIGELANHCGVSVRTLLRHFRAQFGRTPNEYLQQMRIERAKALLESTLLSFDEIVERCGYSDAASFRKLFKRRTAQTPAGYRDRFRLRAH